MGRGITDSLLFNRSKNELEIEVQRNQTFSDSTTQDAKEEIQENIPSTDSTPLNKYDIMPSILDSNSNDLNYIPKSFLKSDSRSKGDKKSLSPSTCLAFKED